MSRNRNITEKKNFKKNVLIIYKKKSCHRYIYLHFKNWKYKTVYKNSVQNNSSLDINIKTIDGSSAQNHRTGVNNTK